MIFKMEKWQRTYIKSNLSSLINDITCDINLIAILLSKNVISEADNDKLKIIGNTQSKFEQTKCLLDILMTRIGGYENLVNSLYQCKQTGGLLTLLKGFDEENISNPFEKCSISLNLDNILEHTILFQGIPAKFGQICENIKPEHLEVIFKNYMSCDTFSKFLTGVCFNLISDTLPPSLQYYIERSLFIRKWLKKSAFRDLRNHVFLFQNVEQSQLTKLAKESLSLSGHSKRTSKTKDDTVNLLTDVSSNQKINLTCRFIILDHIQHFDDISKNATVPVHLIKYENSKFTLVTSSGGFDLISAYLQNDVQSFSEQEFLESVKVNKTICITESPGMGKSVLLTSIGSSIRNVFPNNLVIFIRFYEFVQLFETQDILPNSEQIMIHLATRITTTKLGEQVALAIISSNDFKKDLLFDGYDEIPSDQINLASEILKCVKKYFLNTRIFITSRPHLSEQLQNTLGTYSYHIRPFQKSDQICFLVNYWKTNSSTDLDELKCQEIANICLSNLETNIDEEQRSIAGIPLQCRLLADVYLEDAKLFASSDFSVDNYRISNHITSVFDMYRSHINSCFELIQQQDIRQQVINYHFHQAMKLLFPQMISSPSLPIPNKTIYRIGILQSNNLDEEPRFVHRTFAEFLVAQYLYNCMESRKLNQNELGIHDYLDLCTLVFETSLQSTVHKEKFPFSPIIAYKPINTVILYFLNQFFEIVQDQGTITFFQTMLRYGQYDVPSKFFELICMLISKDYHSLFSFFRKVYMTPEFCANILTLNIPWENVVLLAAKFCDIRTFQDCCKMVENLTKKSISELKYPKLYGYANSATPLHVAVYSGHYQIFEFLSQENNFLDKCKILLHVCISFTADNPQSVISQKIQILKYLVDLKGDILEDDLLLFDDIHINLLQVLVSAGADLSITASDESNAAHIVAKYLNPTDFHSFCLFAIAHNYKEIFMRKNESGETPLYIALQRIDVMTQTLELLSEACHITFNNLSDSGKTELFVAISSKRNVKILKTIVKLGGDWKIKMPNNFCVSHYMVLGKYDCMTYLISLGANVNATGKYDITPLHLATHSNISKNFLKISTLLQYGANVNAKASNGLTPLHFALNYLDIDCVQLLIQNGADVNSKSNIKLTPLQKILFDADEDEETFEMAKLLIKNGASVNALGYNRMPPLFVNPNNVRYTKLLLESGANANATMFKGLTLLKLVDNEECKNLLKEHGAELKNPNQFPWKTLKKKLRNKDCDGSDSSDNGRSQYYCENMGSRHWAPFKKIRSKEENVYKIVKKVKGLFASSDDELSSSSSEDEDFDDVVDQLKE